MKIKKILLALVLSMALLLLFIYMAGGFSRKISIDDPVNAVSTGKATVVKVNVASLPITQEYSGQLLARQQADLAAKISAQVAEVLVKVGDNVEQGDVLLRLANADLDARLNQQLQQLAAAQAQLNQARLEFQRSSQLVKKSLVPVAQQDQAEAELKTAQANFNGAKAAVTEAKTSFGFSLITAPFAGVVSQRWVNQGDYANPGSSLLSLYQPSSLELAVAVPESQLQYLLLGQRWPVWIDALAELREAQLVEISPAVSSASHSLLVKLAFQDTANLYPGLFARLQLGQGEQSVLLVPASAVYQRGQLSYVNRLTPQGLDPTIIKIGPLHDDMIVIRSGVSAVDEVAILNH